MPETVAVVGSRQGADLEHVERFVLALPLDTVVVSGGAPGVDQKAEKTQLTRGGRVKSFRAKQLRSGEWGVEVWELGGDKPTVRDLLCDEKGLPHPVWVNRFSALTYRDMLISEEADSVVAFYRPGRSRGTAFTVEAARAYQKPTYVQEAEHDQP